MDRESKDTKVDLYSFPTRKNRVFFLRTFS